MIKLLLSLILFFGSFLLVYFMLKKIIDWRNKKQATQSEKQQKIAISVQRLGINHLSKDVPKSSLSPKNTICNVQPIWFGKSQKQKKTNYLHVSKNTKLKHKK